MLSFYSRLAFFLTLLTIVLGQDLYVPVVQTSLLRSGVIPDVLPANFIPSFPIEVVYTDPANNYTIAVTAGMNLTIAETTNEPRMAIFSNNSQLIGKQFLVAMVDPDAPKPPNRTLSGYLHYLQPNLVAESYTDDLDIIFFLQNATAPAMPYLTPAPPAGSIPHRYTIALFLQENYNITLDSSTYPANRANFNLTKFAMETGNLTLLGATFFYTAPNLPTVVEGEST